MDWPLATRDLVIIGLTATAWIHGPHLSKGEGQAQ